MKYSYDYDVKRDVSEMFEFRRQTAALLIGMIGLADAGTATKHEWKEFSTTAKTGAISAAAMTAGLTTLTPTTASFSTLEAGQILAFQNASGVTYSERMRVTAVATATATVERGFGSTTAEAISASAVFRVISVAKDEGTSAGDDTTSVPTNAYNAMQIFAKTGKVTGTSQAVGKYGVADAIGFAEEQLADQLLREMNMSAIWGIKQLRTDSVKGTMGGLMEFISTNATSAGTALTSTILNNAIEDVVEKGGSPQTIICHPSEARIISGWNTTNTRYQQSDRIAGGYVSQFESDLGIMPNLGIMNLVADFNMPKDQLFIVDINNIKLVPMVGRAMMSMDATQPGDDAKSRRLLGEYSMEVKNEATDAAIITSLTV